MLPPVRRPVPWSRGNPGARASMERFFRNRRITLYASGTAALARAMAGCAARSPVRSPEVVIPAYGCPDLVAACIHASVHPRLIDIAPGRWSYDLGSLESNLSANTVAIVAVNLLGVGDGAAELTRFCKERRLALIQDSAQFLPRQDIDWPGDYVVLSFGRGKPLNLLHGGALIAASADEIAVPDPPALCTTKGRLLGSRAAAIAFNALTRPSLYGILSALPATGLGDVVYKPLANPARLPESDWRRVATAFELYRRKASYRRDLWAAAVAEWSDRGIVALDDPGSPPSPEPLRLALLAPNRIGRDALVADLNRAGLGATRFYGTDLPNVAGIPETVRRQGPFPNANALAGRLFTLPTHSLVNANAVRTASDLVHTWCRSQSESAR